jgi:small subunit ribosomal protein S5
MEKNNFRNNRRGGNRPDRRKKRPPQEHEQVVLDIARVTRVTKGGKRFSFRTTVAIGDKKGAVGVGLAKGSDVVQSINKAVFQAKKNLIKVPMVNNTIPKQIQFKYGAAKVLLKPATKGNGVKAGGPVRVIAKLAGIENLTAKLLSRTTNKLNIAKAVIGALKELSK